MYYKFSKLAKMIIIMNIVLTLVIVLIHGYNVIRLKENNELIDTMMAERNVTRDTVIEMIEDESGEKLYIDKELTAYFGIVVSILSMIFLYKYSKDNGFFMGFFAAFCCVFTSLIGGFLLFYVILSGKSETSGQGITNRKRKGSQLKDDWEEYIHVKSDSL